MSEETLDRHGFMEHLPRISIVTPSFNQGRFLEQTINSVLSQSYPNLEYIIIDGGSTDASVEIIKRYDKRIAFWCSEKDNGQYDAINKGFSKSTGEILGWINSDDVHFPWTLESVATVMASVPEIDWLSSLLPAAINYRGCLHAACCLPGFSREAFLDGRYVPGADVLTMPFGYIQQESTFWRRGLWEKVGGLRMRYKLAGDFDLWARFFEHAELWGCPIPLAGFRSQYQQRSSDAARYSQECKDALEEMRQTSGWSRPLRRRVVNCLRLSALPWVARLARKVDGRLRPRRYLGHKVAQQRAAHPDCSWAPLRHSF